ncbi:hypothetical protein VTO42DRAFT_8780 [Malbranchea cinnamomea]
MEHPSSISPPSIRICDYNSSHHDGHGKSGRGQHHALQSPSRSQSASSGNSPSSFASSTRTPMTIPGTHEALAPPPLPPPRFIEDLAQGHDSGWKWSNSFEQGQFGQPATLPPIKPTSSLLGGASSRPPLVRRDETYPFGEETVKRATMPPLLSGTSLPDIKMQEGLPRSRDGPTLGSLGSGPPPLRMAYSLQGEKPLSEKSVEQSSNEYDKHLLSMIGKPSSPPRQSFSLSSFLDRESTSLPFHSKQKMSLSTLSIGDAPSRWNNGPPSAAISPGTRPGWGDYLSYRSPSVDSPGPSPMEMDPMNPSRHFGLSGREAASLPSRSNRGSYDQGISPDSDTDFPMDDAGNLRQHSARDQTASCAEGYSPMSRQSMKRRASSPRGPVFDEPAPALHPLSSLGGSDYEHRRSSGFPFNSGVSPGPRYQGSISSMSSASLRNGSYASSTGLSVGASSMSSYDRPSPGGISPTSDLESYGKAFASAGTQKSSINMSTTAGRLSQVYDSTEGKGAQSSVRKASTQSTSGGITTSKHNAPRMGRLHICECCPKKPKKFETIEELRAHEMEKQYFCRYCNKRFKNKNEAERHQNSLHLRRHSWSCAALSSYEAAFHPSSSPAYQTPNGPSHDACGYCGVEFTNFPQPEWDRRIDHLTNVHKFGECNQAKKFYRADHFRQHLKHSHAGSSGKWTNILENACMREEPPAEGILPSIGEHTAGTGVGHDRGG